MEEKDRKIVCQINDDIQEIKRQIKDLQLTLENEVRQLRERVEGIA